MTTFSALDTPVINQQITKDILEQIKNNFDFFRTPPKGFYSPSVAASNITTTSTTFTTITGFTTTFTTQGGLLAVMLALRLSQSVSEIIRLDLTLDGISVTGDDTGLGLISTRVVDLQVPVTIWRILAPAAGSRTVAARWRVASGTGTIYPAGLCQLAVWELYLP